LLAKDMIDFIWQIIAAVAALAAGYFGIRSSWLQHKIDRDKAERAAASAKQESDSIARLSAVRNKYQSQGPIDVAKRNDFEKP
jgi:hypothetical protein